MPTSFWQQKRVFITGASSGIGWALSEHLASRGAHVGLLARRQDKLAELASTIEAAGGRAAFATADVTDPQQMEQSIRTLEDALGPCGVLIANAGIDGHMRTGGFDPVAARAIFTTNVLGVVNTLGAVLPGMVGRGSGHVVAIASIAAMLGLPGVGPYAASKAALVILMQSLRVDLHRHHIKVTTICPGFIDTPMVAGRPRRVLRFLLSRAEAARRIAHAIERGRAEYWFPWQMRLVARVARALPWGLYRRLCAVLERRASGG
jgi:short-subunit dehydrogenase